MRLLAFAILVACVQSVCAQSILKDPKELSVLLNEVVVTGTGTEHYLKDAPVQTEVITGKALDSYQGRSMQDILEGLNASITFNPSDMGSGIQMNGLGNDYILILINGKRINGDTGGQNDLRIINPAVTTGRKNLFDLSPPRQYRTYRDRKRCRLFPVWLGRYRRCYQYYHEKEPG